MLGSGVLERWGLGEEAVGSGDLEMVGLGDGRVSVREVELEGEIFGFFEVIALKK